MTLKSFLYKALAVSNDVNAVRKGRVGRRIARRTVGRVTGRDMSGDLTCRFCLDEPDDWCPACLSLLCEDHAWRHHGSFDRQCLQGTRARRCRACDHTWPYHYPTCTKAGT